MGAKERYCSSSISPLSLLCFFPAFVAFLPFNRSQLASMGLVHFEDGGVLYYPYTPSEAAGYVFLALFATATLAHVGLMFWHKTWFLIPLILGGICASRLVPLPRTIMLTLAAGETFGHYGRAWGGREPNSPSPFMLQLMLILVAPVFIAATVYVTLGKLKQIFLDAKPRRCGISALFIVIDVIAFCSQIGGGLVQVTGDAHIMDIGDSVVLGGLSFQLVALALYLFLVIRFRRRALQSTGSAAVWQRYVWILVASTILIWIRNLVRVIEFAQGFHGFVSEHEVMLYLFDSLLMLLVLLFFAIWHPGNFIRSKRGSRKLEDEEVHLTGGHREITSLQSR